MRIHLDLLCLLLLSGISLVIQTTVSNGHPNISPTQGQEIASKSAPKQATPTVFQADEGDRWLLLGNRPLIFKVDPVTNGSDALVVGTEEIASGESIPTHKHVQEDEVIFVHRGAVHVTLADHEYDARTGATVFIPRGNWISVKNVSAEPALIFFFFSKPAFEQCLRAFSSREGEKFTWPSDDKIAAVEVQCHYVLKN